jgi:hypothetical protein
MMIFHRSPAKLSFSMAGYGQARGEEIQAESPEKQQHDLLADHLPQITDLARLANFDQTLVLSQFQPQVPLSLGRDVFGLEMVQPKRFVMPGILGFIPEGNFANTEGRLNYHGSSEMSV